MESSENAIDVHRVDEDITSGVQEEDIPYPEDHGEMSHITRGS